MTWTRERIRPIDLGDWQLQLRDDDLAQLTFRGREVLRSVRAVVRDRDWATAVWAVEHVSVAGSGATISLVSDAFGTRFAEKITATATTNPFWQFPEYAQIETTIADRVQAVLVGQQSAKDAMAQAGEAAQKLLA